MRTPQLSAGLTLAATPIGNLADASYRLVAALGQADVIAAEDTRRVRQLAAGLGVTLSGRIIAFHDHNEEARADELLDLAAAGQAVLVVSDAGMPTISDPGFRLAARAHERDLPLTVLPGPSAVVTALALSGIATDSFCFDGFLPRKGRRRAAALTRLAAEPRTSIIFESPHRLAATLAELAAACGPEREAAIARELTKIHEEVRRGSLIELEQWARQGVRGEIVIVIAPCSSAPGVGDPGITSPGPLGDEPAEPDPRFVAEVRRLAELGLRMKIAARHVATREGINARELFNLAVADS